VAIKITVLVGGWEAFKEHATAVRHEVFVLEQRVPIDEDLDARDAGCIHAVAYDERGRAVGTGRLLPDAHIGRMAVRSAYRGRGIGSRILEALVDEARARGFREVALSAQTHAISFYAGHGFSAEGDTYLDAGIEHITMRRALPARGDA